MLVKVLECKSTLNQHCVHDTRPGAKKTQKKELTALIAKLPSNLPELLNGFCSSRTESTSDSGTMTRRDLLELCGSADTKKVSFSLIQAWSIIPSTGFSVI